PEETGRAKRHPPVAQTLKGFLESVGNEPEHASDFAQKIAEKFAHFLKREERRLDQNIFSHLVSLLSHAKGEVASGREVEKAKIATAPLEGALVLTGAPPKRGLLVRYPKKFMSARCFLLLFAVAAVADAQQFGRMSSVKENKIGFVVHGGAGTMERGKMTPEREREYRAGIENALRAGWEILQHGGSSLDA